MYFCSYLLELLTFPDADDPGESRTRKWTKERKVIIEPFQMFQSNVPTYFLLSLFSIFAELLSPHSSIAKMYRHKSVYLQFLWTPRKEFRVQILSKSENFAVSLIIENWKWIGYLPLINYLANSPKVMFQNVSSLFQGCCYTPNWCIQPDSLILSSGKYLLSTCNVSGNVLGATDKQ